MEKKELKAELVVHVTNEAGIKKGGIGATLFGLISLEKYHEDVKRTILLGPFQKNKQTEYEMLQQNISIKYLTREITSDISSELKIKFESIEKRYNIEILYGIRLFKEKEIEIILIDSTDADINRLNIFKGKLFDNFGFQSDLFEHDEEFEDCMSIAVPALRTVYTLTDLKTIKNKFLICHDVYAIPTLLASKMMNMEYRNFYFLHEVPCSRDIIENFHGHEIAFYNIMDNIDPEKKKTTHCGINCTKCFRFGMMKLIKEADRIFSVGDHLEREMKYFYPEIDLKIEKIYRGIPNYYYDIEKKFQAKEKIIEYTSSICGFRPDYIFTHITRLIPSKGLWRDLQIMNHIDKFLQEKGKRGILIFLSSVIPEGRSKSEILTMEKEYGWPVIHKIGYPDLVSHEIDCYKNLQKFNKSAKSVRAILVNQFGWSQDKCGTAVPEDMDFHDLRLGTDVEFGLSIYEPFGISHLESLTVGAICVMSSTCGSIGLLKKELDSLENENLIIADYKESGKDFSASALINLEEEKLTALEMTVSEKTAQELIKKLPQNFEDHLQLFKNGYKMSNKLSWDKIYDELYRQTLQM